MNPVMKVKRSRESETEVVIVKSFQADEIIQPTVENHE
jgi:hypothetical protein